MPPRERKQRAVPADPLRLAMQEAESLQQRAERRRGREAVVAHQAAAASFEALLSLLPGSPAVSRSMLLEAYFGLAESLQNWAEAILDVCTSLEDLTLELEAQSAEQAAGLFRRAVQAYEQVQEDGRLRVDAAVNAANALCAWAEVERGRGQSAKALQLLEAAEGRYQEALQQEEDAPTLSNLADSLVQRAEVCCEAGHGEAAGPLYSAAAAAYSQACQLSSSEQGDDLPGLLVNWAAGLLSMATHAQDSATALALLDDAAQRLRRAAEFDRGDAAPLTALGEVLVARAECLLAAGSSLGACAPDGVVSPEQATAVEAAEAALRRGLEEGYLAALRIRAGEADALVGAAECHTELARLAEQAGSTAAQQHWAEAAAAYSRALQQPTLLGKYKDRQDVRFNYACTLAKTGRHAEAADLLRGLLAAGAVTAADIAADADLAGVVL